MTSSPSDSTARTQPPISRLLSNDCTEGGMHPFNERKSSLTGGELRFQFVASRFPRACYTPTGYDPDFLRPALPASVLEVADIHWRRQRNLIVFVSDQEVRTPAWNTREAPQFEPPYERTPCTRTPRTDACRHEP